MNVPAKMPHEPWLYWKGMAGLISQRPVHRLCVPNTHPTMKAVTLVRNTRRVSRSMKK